MPEREERAAVEGEPRRGLSRARLALGAATCLAGLGLAATAAVRGPFRQAVGEGGDGAGARPGLAIAVALGYDAPLIDRELAPLAAHLDERLGASTSFRPVARVADAIERLGAGEVDVAVLPALGCVQALEWVEGARLLAIQSRGESFGEDGVLVCRQGRCPPSIEGISALRLCYVDPGDAAGFLAARAWLRSHDLDPALGAGRATPSGGHHAALRDLLSGRCDLAAVSASALESAEAAGLDGSALRAFATTGHVPLPCWVATSRLGSDDRAALRDALLGFGAGGRGVAPGPLLGLRRFRLADSSTYDGVRVVARLAGLLRRPEPPTPG